MGTLEIKGARILLDGEPFRILSGAIHYFRVHPGLWDDRLEKAAAFGLNTVETYAAWNIHEPKRGSFNFSGIADIESFIDKAAAHGLKVILRPGPFICAEWDNGGFPAWLNAVPGIEMRRMNKPYLEAVEAYFDVLLPKIGKRLYSAGGPIILVSLENEYGSYCHDKEYLEFLLSLYRKHGIDAPIATNDGPRNHHLIGGTIPEAAISMDFGSKSDEAWENKEKFRPGTPDFCMEFWVGWFDHWGEKHHVRDAAGADGGAATELERMLKAGAHVNLYMFHGGTNFGFTNGANGNHFSDYAATVTSYDYDSPLSECGDPTPKFEACQKVVKDCVPSSRTKPVRPTKKLSAFTAGLSGSAGVLENLDVLAAESGKARKPPTMEALGQNFGFIHYRKRLAGPLSSTALRLYGVNDYAQVWLDGRYLGSRMRDDGRKPFSIDIGPEGAQLDLLVENCGRINYGPHFGRDFKGISHAVTVEYQEQQDWEYWSLPLERLDALSFGQFSNEPGKVSFHCGEFILDETGDCFLKRPGVKGSVWINGWHLGRYWDIGPTETLYVPAPVLREGANSVIVMEQESLVSGSVFFEDKQALG